jgi:uncharacterized protein (DUF433 family)
MMLSWNICYLDRADKQFKDRCLYLDTKTLDSVTRATVELVADRKWSKTEREILKFRHLFIEDKSGTGPVDPNKWDSFSTVDLSEYFEDETGEEITGDEVGRILTGSPTARLIPHGAKQHDIELMLSERKPIPVAEVSLDPDALRLLGYFVRDLKEMMDSAFMKDGPGSLVSFSGGNPTLKTAVTDEEIRSFVTIFRRLYMTGRHDRASFMKVIPIFNNAIGDHPYAKWVAGVAREYQNHLDSVPYFGRLMQPGACTFPTKRLIDVFLYTQYAHQPDEERQRQFGECLKEVHGKPAVLTWMFLTEIWRCSLEFGNAGRVISSWFKHYCDYRGVSPDVLKSLRDEHPGLGAAEKDENRRDQLLREMTEKLATELWNQDGRPEGGPSRFLMTAREQLSNSLQAVADMGSMITVSPGICGGRPHIAGTGVSVRRVAGWYKLGRSPDEISDQYGHLSIAQVHAALAYYHANRDEIDAELAEEEAEYDRLAAVHGSNRGDAP